LDLTEASPKLVLAAPVYATHEHYVAFSYYWGSNPTHILLTNENIEDLKGGIPCNILPKTFREVIDFTKRLGIIFCGLILYASCSAEQGVV
jgi:hypothetical protein